MAITLSVPNVSDRNIKERSSLVADVAVGATTIILTNNQNIITGDVCLVGSGETAELVTIASVSGTTATLSAATVLFHNENEPVIGLIGSQIKLYRATNVSGTAPADSNFSAILSPVTIDPDQPMTTITDASGTSDNWYKFTYYNPTTVAETPLSDSVATRGGGIGNYVSIEDIRQEAGFKNNPNISDGLIDLQRQFAQSMINSSLAGIYTIPFTSPINPLIQLIALKYSAGLLQIDQYGTYTTVDTTNGTSRVTWAEGMIEKLKSGQLTLQDAAGVAVPENNVGVGFSGSPNSGTISTFKFTSVDRY